MTAARPSDDTSVPVCVVRPAVLTDAEAAQYIGMPVATLRASRLRRPRTVGPPYLRYGRSIRYRLDDLDAWLASRRVVPVAMTEAGA